MSEQNKAIARLQFENSQSQEVVLMDKIVAANYVGHTSFNEFYRPEGAEQLTAMLRKTFPDLQVIVDEQITKTTG